MAKRIMGDANGGLQNSINEKAIKQCRISDIEGAIRPGKGRKQTDLRPCESAQQNWILIPFRLARSSKD